MFFHVFARPPTLSQRHMDLHVWAYPRPGYMFQVSSKSVQGCRSPRGQNLALPITLASRFYNNLYYRTRRGALKSACIRVGLRHHADCANFTMNKSSSEDEIANVNVLRRHRTCRGQSLRPLNWVPTFYCKCSATNHLCASHIIKSSCQSLFCVNNAE